MALMMCAVLFAIPAAAENVTLESISATKSEITLDYSAEVPNGSFALLQGGVPIAVSVSKTNDGKTVVITPNEALALDTVYVLHVTGVSDNGYYKAFKLETLFADDFQSYTNVSDMDSVWNVSYRDFGKDYTVSGFNEYAGSNIYSLENGWLVIDGNKDNGAINIKSDDVSQWNNYTLELDVKRDSRYYLDIMYHMIRVNGKPGDFSNNFRLGIYGPWRADACFTTAQVNTATEWSVFTEQQHHLKLTTKTGKDLQVFKDGTNVLSQTYNNTLASYAPGGEIGFKATGNGQGKQYIDNVLAYKLVMLSEIPDIATPAVTGNFEVGKSVECSVDCDSAVTSSFDISYQWYRGDDYFEDAWELIENANSQSYTITNDDEDKYLFCEVTFTHNTDADFKIILKCEPTHAPLPPVARNYKLVYNKDENSAETLTVYYEYFDANNDKQASETFLWEESSTGEDGSWTAISETSKTYTIKDTDINKYIRCTLTVENDKAETSEPATEVYMLPFTPTAKDGSVTISGSAAVGKTLTATYTYFDNNGDEEGESERNWYRVDKNGNRELVGSGSTAYGIKSDDRGYSIQFGYKPVSTVYPKEGIEVFSNKIDIPAKSNNNSSGGGSTGGGSIGGGSITVTKPAPKDDNVKTPEQTETDIGDVFSDMKTHWAKKYVADLYKKGLINGRGDGYCPEDKVTRAEWVTMMLRSAGKSGQGSYNNCFTDVNAGDWYAKDIQTAFTLGIIKGSDNGFMPNENITREQMAKIAIDTYELVKGEINEKSDLNKFTDSENVSEWAVSYMEKAIKLGIINGMSDNSLSPKSTATRAEAAAVLSRVYNLIQSN